jgi:flagellar protein FliS
MSPAPQSVYKAYHKATHTVAKTRQVVMLYDGAIRFLKQAREDMLEKRIEARFHKLVRVGEIIMGLQASLDFDNGGDSAKILYNYYSNLDMRILSLHRTNNIDECERIIADIKEMRDVWDRIDRGEVNSDGTVTPKQELPPATSGDSVAVST